MESALSGVRSQGVAIESLLLHAARWRPGPFGEVQTSPFRQVFVEKVPKQYTVGTEAGRKCLIPRCFEMRQKREGLAKP